MDGAVLNNIECCKTKTKVILQLNIIESFSAFDSCESLVTKLMHTQYCD